MFCAKCGKKAVMENFCEECYADTNELFTSKDFVMPYCDLCGFDAEEVKKEAAKRVKSDNEIEDIYVTMRIVGNKAHTTIDCIGKIDGVKKKEKKKILIILQRKMCEMHVKLSGGYYEAVLQVRGDEKEMIMRHLKKLLPKKSIVSVESLKEGYDIKVMSKATAAAAAKVLKNKHEVISSFKLVGSKKGQMLYRNFYSIR